MSTTSLYLVLLGFALAVYITLRPPRGATRPAALAMAGAAFSVIAGAAVLLSAGYCTSDATAAQCTSTAARAWLIVAGVAGVAQGGLLLSTLYVAKRPRRKQALLSACMPLSAMLFSLVIFSVGIFLIVPWWVGLVWLVTRAADLRAPMSSDAT